MDVSGFIVIRRRESFSIALLLSVALLLPGPLAFVKDAITDFGGDEAGACHANQLLDDIGPVEVRDLGDQFISDAGEDGFLLDQATEVKIF